MEKDPTILTKTDEKFTRLYVGSVLPTEEEIQNTNDISEIKKPSQFSKKFKKFWKKHGKTISASAAATLVASAGATDAKNIDNQQIDLSTNPSYEAVDPGFHDTIPGRGKIKAPGVAFTWEDPGRPVEESEDNTNSHNDIPYLDQFEIPNTGSENVLTERTVEAQEELREKIINKILEDIRKAVDNGYDINSINIQGFNSDESRKGTDTYSGLGQDDPENEWRARQEAEIIKRIVEKEISKQFDPEVAKDLLSKITISEGEEIHNQAINDQIGEIAKAMGISAADLLMQFNTNPDSLPTDIQDSLAGLRNDRFVRVSMTASKKESTAAEKSNLKSFVLIPLLIPLYKRKKNGSGPDPEDGGDTPPEKPDPKPIPPIVGYENPHDPTPDPEDDKPDYPPPVPVPIHYRPPFNDPEPNPYPDPRKPEPTPPLHPDNPIITPDIISSIHEHDTVDPTFVPKRQNFGVSPNVDTIDQFKKDVAEIDKRPRQHNFNPNHSRRHQSGDKRGRSSGGDKY